jgi:peptidoglycan hydrolase-like protein with peptidoglycan-binding domain
MRTAIALASMIAGGALAVLPATAASATTTYCQSSTSVGTFDLLVPAVSSTNHSTVCSLKQAAQTGNGVKALQTALNVCYGYSLAVDGSFGSATYSALYTVQGLIGATQDGEYGAQTQSKLKFSSNDIPGHAGCKNI